MFFERGDLAHARADDSVDVVDSHFLAFVGKAGYGGLDKRWCEHRNHHEENHQHILPFEEIVEESLGMIKRKFQ